MARHKLRAMEPAWVTRDIDGETRPMGAASDAGADECRLEVIVCLPETLRNY